MFVAPWTADVPIGIDEGGGTRRTLQTTGRAAVTKVKYLYYF